MSQLFPSEGNAEQGDVSRITAEINRVLDQHPRVRLRERVIRRVALCSLAFGLVSESTDNANEQQGTDLSEISAGILIGIWDSDLSLEEVFNSSEKALDKIRKTGSLSLLLRNCRSFTEPSEVSDAVLELEN